MRRRPLPGIVRTRAMLSFRRPTDQSGYSISDMTSLTLSNRSSSGLRLRFGCELGPVRMGASLINFQASQLAIPKSSFAKHTGDRKPNGPLWFALQKFTVRCDRFAARKTRVTEVDLLGGLIVSRDANSLCVDNDDMVTAINVRREITLPFPHQDTGNFRRQTSQNLVFRVDEMPSTHNCLLSRLIRFHKHKAVCIPICSVERQRPFPTEEPGFILCQFF